MTDTAIAREEVLAWADAVRVGAGDEVLRVLGLTVEAALALPVAERYELLLRVASFGLLAHHRGQTSAAHFCFGLAYFAREFDLVDLVVKRLNGMAVA